MRAKPLDAGATFGGEVNDTAGASKKGERKADDAPEKKRKRRAKADDAPVEVLPEHEAEALGFLKTLDGGIRMIALRRYDGAFTPETLVQLDGKLKFTQAELDALTPPLAQGIAEMGLEVPWWAKLTLAGIAVTAPRVAVLSTCETHYQEWLKTQPQAQAKAKAQAPEAKKEGGA